MFLLYFLYRKERWYYNTMAVLNLFMCLDLLGFHFLTEEGWFREWWLYGDSVGAGLWAGLAVVYFLRSKSKCCSRVHITPYTESDAKDE